MSKLEATVVVEFNGGDADTSDYIALIELDDVSNEDKTSFLPGETPVFRCNFSSNVRVDAVVPLEGSIKYIGAASRAAIFTNIFTSRTPGNPSTYELPVVPSNTSVSFGTRNGKLMNTATPTGILTYSGDVALAPFKAMIDTTYPVSLYRLTPPELTLDANETYEIVIVFYLTLE